jgi:N4-gp56 family major capsid protein
MAGQLWTVDVLGGFMYSDELSDKLRVELLPAVKFRQLCDARDAMEKGLNAGEKYNWNVYSRVTTGGAALTETVAMPETNFTITQGQLSITEYGNSVPYTGKLNDLSRHPVEEIIKKVLKIDAKETLDGAAHAQFKLSGLTVTPTSGNSATAVTVEEGGCTITNNIALNKEHVKGIVDAMKERNVPPYIADDYYGIGWPTTFRTFKNNLEAISFYVETGFKHIMNGEIGRYENTRFIEQTHVAKGGAVDSVTWNFRTADPWNNALSDWAFFLGEDTVAEAIAIPEEIRGKIPTDFGRSRGIAWYYLGGFGIVHAGSASDSWDNCRIMRWESAA